MLCFLSHLASRPPAERLAYAQQLLEAGVRPDPDADQEDLLGRLQPALEVGVGVTGAEQLLCRWEAEGFPSFVVIAVDAGGAWLGLACLQALLAGSALLLTDSAGLGSIWGRVQGQPIAVTVVAPPDRLGNRTLARLSPVGVERDRAGAPLLCRLGLLTGRTPGALLDLILRSAAVRIPGIPRRSLLVNVDGMPEEPSPPPPDLSILNGQETTQARIREGLGEDAGVLNLLAHGRDDVLWIKGALICGRAPEAGPSGEYGGLPSCARRGICYQPHLSLLDPATLNVPVVFLNSCAPLKLAKSVFPTSFNIGLRFLDGAACALVASPFMTNGKPWQNILFHGLLQTGRSIGEAVRIVNEATWRSGVDLPGMHLVGDPDLAVREPVQHTVAVWSGGGPDRPRCFATQGRHFLEIDLPWTRAQPPFALTAAEHLAAKHPIYYAYAATDSGIRLFVFSLWSLPAHLTLTARASDTFEELRGHYSEATKVIETAECLGLRDQQTDRMLPELRQTLRSVRPVAEAYRYCLQDANRSLRRSRHLAELKERVKEFLLARLISATRERNLQLYETYREVYAAEGWVWGDEDCPLCGDPVVSFRTRNNLKAGVVREVSLCATCGIVQDTSCGVVLRLEGAGAIGPEPAKMVLHVQNRSPEWREMTGVIAPVNGQLYGMATSPERFRLELGPGEEATVPVEVTASPETPPHHYWIRAYALSQGDLTFTGANLWVRGAREG